MKTALYRTLMLACCCLVGMRAASAGATTVTGIFALQGKTAQTSALLVASPVGSNPLSRRFDIVLTPSGSRVPLRSYDVDMTKFMHVIIVNDDFTLFLHVHPVLQRNGHFVLQQRFPFPGLYHIYADTQPHGIGQQVFRFDLPIGNFQAARSREMGETNTTAHVGGYTVTLSAIAIYANEAATIDIEISKHGKPAKDLHPYLGALAHAVFLNAQDLTYVHVHPMPASMTMGSSMDMESMKSLPDTATVSPEMMLHVTLNETGLYKLWFQFRGGNQLIVAPFAISAR